MRGTLIGATALLITIAAARAQEAIPTTEPSCNLISPPARSGEVFMHAGIFKVFPRKSDMGGDYTGCQTLWLVSFDESLKVASGYLERGVLVLFRIEEKGGIICRYESKTLVTKSADCAEFEDTGFPFSSFAAGCHKEVNATQQVPDWCKQMD
jgi:hypothetical protein